MAVFLIPARICSRSLCFDSGEGLYRIAGLRVRMQTFMPPSAAKTERRRKFRKRPLTLVYVELAATNGGMMRDLSEEGFALRAMMPLRAGEKTPFSFSLNESARIEGEGEILWTEENGRVAGIRFGQISSLARTQIHDWLSGALDSRKSDGIDGIPTKPEAPHAPTLEQLREELRSTPSREESPVVIQTAAPAAVPEIPPAACEVAEARPAIESAALDLPVPESSAPSRLPVPEELAIPTPIPRQPPLPPVQNLIITSAQPIPSAPVYRHDTLPPVELPEPLPLSAIAESDELPPLADPSLPDISEILIQPRGRGNRFSPNTSGLEPLTALEHSPETPRASWAHWFTLSRAIGIMLFLTVAVAISAYHRDVGQALIWLGEQMGGAEASQSVVPASNDAIPASTSEQPSSVPEPAAPPPANANRKDATGAIAAGDNQQASLSSVTKNALPPVTPLSGMSTLPSSDANQGTGQEGYVRAMQLLRGKNAAADTPEAVRLLWISVEKGHPGAEVALADLFWHGRGVVRNCDQTRILLSAAARKGNTEAQKRLQQFQREGCE